MTRAASSPRPSGARRTPSVSYTHLLSDPDYYDALIRLLFAAVPIVGVLRRDGVPDGEWEELYALLARDPDTLILRTTGKYDINASGALRHWTLEWAKA